MRPSAALVLLSLAGLGLLVGLAVRKSEENQPPSVGDSVDGIGSREMPMQVLPKTSKALAYAKRAEIACMDFASALENVSNSMPSIETTPSAGSRSSTIDEEWAGFPRTPWDFARKMASLDRQLTASTLFRHRQLNPRDIYISRERRSAIYVMLDSSSPMLERLWFEYSNALTEEMEAAVQLGIAKDVTELSRIVSESSPTGETRQLVTVGLVGMKTANVDFATWRGGKLLGVRMQALPVVSQIDGVRRFLAMEFGGRILAWFHATGCLSESEVQQLTQSLAAYM